MEQITRVGVDLAKRVIQVHAVSATGRVMSVKTLARDKFMAWCVQLPPRCLIAMEACSGGHHWARKLRAMDVGCPVDRRSLRRPVPHAGQAREERRQRRGGNL
jgi:transposase